ncbi:hypothetical protein EOM81_01655 [bacterium]|nr:hypothetical protein [bacterium]
MAISKKIQKLLEVLKWDSDMKISLVNAGLKYVSFSIVGDWKHTHLYFEHILQSCCQTLGLTCEKTEVLFFEDNNDWYGAIKTFRIE